MTLARPQEPFAVVLSARVKVGIGEREHRTEAGQFETLAKQELSTSQCLIPTSQETVRRISQRSVLSAYTAIKCDQCVGQNLINSGQSSFPKVMLFLQTPILP